MRGEGGGGVGGGDEGNRQRSQKVVDVAEEKSKQSGRNALLMDGKVSTEYK